MSTSIDETQVRHIAQLSRLKLSDEEARLFAGQLAQILEYIKQLEALDTSGVEPMAHPLPVTNVLRDDQPHLPVASETALRNAPQREGPFFKVPAVLDPSAGA
jgi:aspartyl-tRNA(Asn)/glutamyl-tRNA(Gln) amidotransferase subunit C